MAKSGEWRPMSALLLSVFILAQAGPILRWTHLSPELAGFWRMLMVMLLIGPYMIFRIRGHHQPLKTFANVGILIAGVFFFLHYLLFFYSVKYTSLANSVLFFSLNPLFISIGAALFLNEKFTFRFAVALIAAIAGLALVEFPHMDLNKTNWQGDLYAILSALMFAVYALLVKPLRSRYGNMEMTLVFNIICLAGFLIVTELSQPLTVPTEPQAWLAILALAVGPSLLGHAMFSYSIKSLPVGMASSAVLLEPIFAALVGLYFFNEPVEYNAVLGFLIITGGLLYLFQPKFRYD